MKNHFYRFLGALILFGAFFLTSCDKEDEPQPDPKGPKIASINNEEYKGEGDVLTPGEEFKVGWLAEKGDSDLGSIKVFFDDVAVKQSILEKEDADSYSDEITLTAPEEEGTYIVKFEITDDNGLKASTEFRVIVEVQLPTITLKNDEGFVQDGDEILPGEEFKVGWGAEKGDFNLGSITITFDGEIVKESILEEDNAESYSDEIMLTAPDEAGSYIVNIEIADKNGFKAFSEFTIVVPEPSVNFFETVLLAAPLEDLTSKTFYSSSRNETYSIDDVNGTDDPLSDEIDFGYYYDEGVFKASLAGIDDYPTGFGYSEHIEKWNTKNKTLFKVSNLTEEDFENISEYDNQKIIAEFEVGDQETGDQTNLQEGDILAFKTKVNGDESESR
ncbi:hypothetical protein, partial [Xanthovirga aplysinae]|uniref:hypothetical protein n=1 Tax=Xanthovirga aplysinae TaxID=2529853 RepID=UPI0012BC2DAD